MCKMVKEIIIFRDAEIEKQISSTQKPNIHIWCKHW